MNLFFCTVRNRSVLNCLKAFAVLAALLFGTARNSFAGIMPGTLGQIAFDFINGTPGLDGNNEMDIFGISVSDSDTDNYVTPNQFDADDDPLTLNVLEFERAISIAYRTNIAFTFKPLSDVVDLNPDSFSFLLLDTLGNSLFTTDAPGGSNVLFSFDFVGDHPSPNDPLTNSFGTLNVYGDLDPDTSWTVTEIDEGIYNVQIQSGVAQNGVIPEPSSVLLWSVLAVGIGVYSRRRI